MSQKRLFSVYAGWLFLATGMLSCGLDRFFPCQHHVPQRHAFGRATIMVRTGNMTLHIGDTTFVRFRLPRQLYDSLSKQVVPINGGVALWVKLTTVSAPVTAGNAFAVDTTIFTVFDQYFATRLVRGSKRTAYNFDCVLIDGYWELAVQFIARKKGHFVLTSRFERIATGEPALPKGVCMLGDAETFSTGLRLSTINNQLRSVYPALPLSEEEYFGFVVD